MNCVDQGFVLLRKEPVIGRRHKCISYVFDLSTDKNLWRFFSLAFSIYERNVISHYQVPLKLPNKEPRKK